MIHTLNSISLMKKSMSGNKKPQNRFLVPGLIGGVEDGTRTHDLLNHNQAF